MTIYEVWPVENDPDNGPREPPKRGSWTWWRTGPHPMGRYQAMDWSGGFGQAFADNRTQFPIMQDQALGDSGDFGGQSCHACDYIGDGYPEPDHHTRCDGICKREPCQIHGASGRKHSLEELTLAFTYGLNAGLSKKAMIKHLRSL